jgi:hypothetical protein
MGSLSEKTTRTDWNSKHAEFAKDAIEAAKLHDPYTRGKVTGYRSYPSGKIMVIAD